MYGLVAEWLCRGLQILVCRFDSDPSLQNSKRRLSLSSLFSAIFLYLQNATKIFNLAKELLI